MSLSLFNRALVTVWGLGFTTGVVMLLGTLYGTAGAALALVGCSAMMILLTVGMDHE